MHTPGIFGIVVVLALLVGMAFALRGLFRWFVAPKR